MTIPVSLRGTRSFWALLCGVLSLSLACRDGNAADAGARAAAGPLIPAVEATQVREGGLPLFERLTGTVRASGEVAIYPEASGTISEVLVENGTRVRQGDVLVRIRTAGSEAQVAQARSSLAVARAARQEAEANLEQLEAQYKRNAELGEQGLVPADLVTTLRTSVDAARAAVTRARAQAQVAEGNLAERADVRRLSTVRAPITGMVGQRAAEVGMRVSPQEPLFVMGRLADVRVEIPVTQDLLAHVKRGQRVEISVQGRPQPIIAEVSRISPFLASGSYTAEVEVDVPNPDGVLVPGMFVTVDVYYGESTVATLVPASALYTHPDTGQRGVYVSAEQPSPAPEPGAEAAPRPPPTPVPFRPVEVVAEGPEVVALTNLAKGDWVVVVGQHLLAAQGADDTPQARVRAIAWERILELQRLQRDDLLREYMERQQRLAGGAPSAGSD